MHKFSSDDVNPSFRPIVSSIGTYNYNLAKYLGVLLSPSASTFSCEGSFTFVKEVKEVRFLNKFMVSFDVTSLFTNIPLDETINIALDRIFTNHPNIKISKSDLKKLFLFATAQTHFLFKGDFYDQIDGVAMGSPLAPILANIFMAFYEEKWLSEFEGNKPIFYRRYVDDIFALFNSEAEALVFFHYINNKHKNIKFTMEKEIDNKLSFLDVFLDNSSTSLKTSVFRKKTFTGLLTGFNSFTSFSYKSGLIKCLIDRAFKINNTWFGFHVDLENIKHILQKNLYPNYLIDNIVKTYLNKHCCPNENNSTNKSDNVRYYRLPFTGKFSEQLQNKLNNLIKKYCKSVAVKIVFTSFKIGQIFSTKDSVPSSLKSNVVYQFKCAGCSACYIGETTRHLSSRILEHLKTDKNSHVYKHLQNNLDCFNKSNSDCFSTLDTAKTKFQLKLKEGMYIGWGNPDLNRQVKYVLSTLSV